ncbi:hypothetical protein [Streptosporangium longisporum]|uniref:Uncharacterized protein n=1 Tax=Streptosporangium longisporum TaxID=46187 RepID=A0ABP6L3L1_9ACTN
MNQLLLSVLALAGLGVDLTRQVLIGTGDLPMDPVVEATLAADRAVHDQLPVAEGLDQIRARIARRSER